MTRTALEIINETEFRAANFTKFQPCDIWERTEHHIKYFITNQKDYCDRAETEGWLGEPWIKGKSGLLGYMRTSFAIQLKTIEKIKIDLPIYDSRFVKFFRSDWFRSTCLENGSVQPIYKKEHFELLKSTAN